MYRPQIKVFDCTIRDGGLINKHFFEDQFVRAVYEGLSKAGVDYMEFGYRSSKQLCPIQDFGAWKYCDDEKIFQIIEGIQSTMKTSIMVDAHRVREQTFSPKDKSPVHMIRVATYVKDVDKAIDLIHRVHDLGYETTANIMAVSTEKEPELVEALRQLAKCPVDVVYVVDSFGALFCEEIDYFVKLYQDHCPGKELGIHCHNNQQLAFSNTIEAIIRGVNFLDASLYGIGRGSGNCCVELLLGFLKNPKFNLSPVLKVIQDHMIPLRDQLEWGYLIPYMVTGILNRHPDFGIKRRASAEKDKYAEFYEEMLEVLDS
jgi:4-hydroxy 2-oxovalerate aldolase